MGVTLSAGPDGEHHTFDAFMPETNHNDYEAAADGLGETFAPVADGHKRGIYEDELPVADCVPGSRTCFPAFAAHASHDPVILQAAADGDYSHIHVRYFVRAASAGAWPLRSISHGYRASSGSHVSHYSSPLRFQISLRCRTPHAVLAHDVGATRSVIKNAWEARWFCRKVAFSRVLASVSH